MSEWNGTPPFKKTLARRQINSSDDKNTCFSTLYTVSTRRIFSVHPQAEETRMAKFKPALYFISKRPSHCGSDEMQCDKLTLPERRGRTQKTQIKEEVMSPNRSTSSGLCHPCCPLCCVCACVWEEVRGWLTGDERQTSDPQPSDQKHCARSINTPLNISHIYF